MYRSVAAIAAALLGSISASLAGESPPIDGREGLNATLWMQTAHEYAYLTQQVYMAADAALATAKQEPSALADPAAPAPPRAAQAAIILDLDATVLDNSRYQASLVARDGWFDSRTWKAWAKAGEASLVAGALGFLRDAAAQGYRIFYVTNRACPDAGRPERYPHPLCPQRTETLTLARRLKLPYANDPEAFLFRNDQTGWDRADKSARRLFLGERYRVVMLLGDDLGDFLAADQVRELRGSRAPDVPVSEALQATTDPWRAKLGSQWFLLPNPVYGSWERALGGCPTTDKESPRCYQERVQEKYQKLITAQLPASESLRIASWNMEWLIRPQDYAAMEPSCTAEQPPSDVRGIPCDAPRRSARDFRQLRSYAEKVLSADVVALQEVDGAAAATEVFPNYDFCFSHRAHPQKTGFALRKAIPFRCGPHLTALDVNGQTRAGAVVTLFPGTSDEMRLISVHLKSGCFAKSLDADDPICEILRQQVSVLERWLDTQEAAQEPVIILGDFNRHFNAVAERKRGGPDDAPISLFNALSDDEPAGTLLHTAALKRQGGLDYVKCRCSEPYTDYIDAIVFDARSWRRTSLRAFERPTYQETPFNREKLSDHCPVLQTIELE